jgi:hypothetical protein
MPFSTGGVESRPITTASWSGRSPIEFGTRRGPRVDPSKGVAKGLRVVLSAPIVGPLSERRLIYLCAQKLLLFVASLGASSELFLALAVRGKDY